MTKTDISNLAIGHLNIGKNIADVDTEASEPARACKKFYDMALKQTLGDFAWPFAKRIVALAEVAGAESNEWGFIYRYPSNAVKLRRILSGQRNDTRQSRVPYLVGSDDDGELIYTDTYQAEMEYTHYIDNADRFPQDFVMALSLRLAMYIAPLVTGGDPFKLSDRARQMYMMELSAAKANAENEQQSEEEPEAECIRARS